MALYIYLIPRINQPFKSLGSINVFNYIIKLIAVLYATRNSLQLLTSLVHLGITFNITPASLLSRFIDKPKPLYFQQYTLPTKLYIQHQTLLAYQQRRKYNIVSQVLDTKSEASILLPFATPKGSPVRSSRINRLQKLLQSQALIVQDRSQSSLGSYCSETLSLCSTVKYLNIKPLIFISGQCYTSRTTYISQLRMLNTQYLSIAASSRPFIVFTLQCCNFLFLFFI